VFVHRINGASACGNRSTLIKILRDEIGFKGFVTSDWGATHAVTFINAGLDMENARRATLRRNVLAISDVFRFSARSP
jgi:beta-glucosidase-like glycosyl hydrolase